MENTAFLNIIKRKESLLFLVLLISGLSLLGWLTGKIVFASVLTNYIPIAPSTALLFTILCILFLINNKLEKSHISKSIVLAILIFVVLFCLTVFLNHLFNFRLDIENIFIENPEKLGSIPIGHMSPLTSLLFIFIVISIWGINENNSGITKYICGSFSLLTGLVSLVLLIGYLYKAPLLYGGQTIPVALLTAICFFLFSITLLRSLEYRFWTFNLINDNKITNQLLKSFLPFVVAIVLIEGYLNNIISFNSINATLTSSIFLLIALLITIYIIIRISVIIGNRLLRVEKALKESEEKFSLAIKFAPFPIMIHAENGKVLNISQGWANSSGYTIEDIPTIDDWTERAYGVRKQNIKEYIDTLYDLKDTKTEGEYIIKCKDKTERIWDFSSAFLGNFDNHGRVVISMANDVTVRKQAEQEIIAAKEQAEQSNKELEKLNDNKDKFFSIIAHDLKSPFNSILGFSDLLIEQIRKKDYAGIDKYAKIIKLSSTKALDLLMNLMEWSRSQTGRMEFNPEYFELVELIKNTELYLRGVFQQKKISLTKNIPTHTPIFADKNMISTILRNLISNALKFTHSGGKISISVEEKKLELVVSVSDTGVGISKADSKKLFKIDQTYSTSGTKNEKGTGLGLILCKEFVEKHGGKIWVESEVWNGSRFYFTIPRST